MLLAIQRHSCALVVYRQDTRHLFTGIYNLYTMTRQIDMIIRQEVQNGMQLVAFNLYALSSISTLFLLSGS